MPFLNNARADRATDPALRTGTDDCLGPGRYSTASQFPAQSSNILERFQGSEKRDAFRPRTADAVPGPGSYDARLQGTFDEGRAVSDEQLRPSGPQVLSCSAFRARAEQRGSPSASGEEVPGPGAYETCGTITKASCGTGVPPGETVPPVPMAEDIHSPGPAAYSVSPAAAASRPSAPSADFSSSESKRNFLDGKDEVPGPGAYYTRKALAKGPYSSFRSSTGRGQSYDTCSPGPAMYDDSGAFAAEKLGDTAVSSFRSGSSRDPASSKSGDRLPAPGPGRYEQPKSPFAGAAAKRARGTATAVGQTYYGVQTPQQHMFLRDTQGSVLCAFDATSPRPLLEPSEREDAKVDPGTYDCDDVMGRSLSSSVKNLERAKGKNGVFGTTADRFVSQIQETPDPCAYHQASTFVSAEPTATGFSSTTQRPILTTTRSEIESSLTASPGTYQALILSALDYRSKLMPAQTEHVSFGSSKERFGPLQGRLEPGPGAYKPTKSTHVKLGLVKSTDSRIGKGLDPVDMSGGSVGPGAYEVESSLLKKSFNVSHAEHARRTLAARAPAVFARGLASRTLGRGRSTGALALTAA